MICRRVTPLQTSSISSLSTGQCCSLMLLRTASRSVVPHDEPTAVGDYAVSLKNDTIFNLKNHENHSSFFKFTLWKIGPLLPKSS